MPLGNQSHGQQNGLNAPWLQSSHPQLSPDGASRSFSEWQADQYAAPAFTGYHEATPVVQHQFSSIPFHFQHLNLDDVTSATIDSMANTQAPLFPTTSDVLHQPGNGGLLGGLGGSNRPSTATESLLPTIERTSGALPKSSVPTMPMPQRKSRARQPSPEEWENHKAIIEHFYLKQNFSLADTMEELGTVHEFFATEKMYKDKFKQWKWSKNLPRDMAMGMLSKAKQRQPKQTVFQWRNQTWTMDRINKTHGKFVNQSDPGILESYPTPQGVTWETPRATDIVDSPCGPENAQGHGSNDASAYGNATDAAKNPGRTIDEGPFHINMNQASVATLTSAVKAAVEADRQGNPEEAESGLRDALSCASRLLSPTDNETIAIGHVLATFYAVKGRMADADDVLNWMINKHCSRFGLGHPKTTALMLNILNILRSWQRNGAAELLIYRLLESQRNPDECPVFIQHLTNPAVVSKEMMEDLLASGDVDRAAGFVALLDDLASDSGNHKLLQGLMPQIIERCDGYQQTHGKLAIQSRCVLAEILTKDAQHERAINILRGGARSMKQQVDVKSLLEPSTLALFGRVGRAFFEANDPETCDKVLERVAVVVEAHASISQDESVVTTATEFFISTAYWLQQKCTWERSRPWVERALALAHATFGQNHKWTKRLEVILETRVVQQTLFSRADLDTVMTYFSDHMMLRVADS